MTKNDFHFPAIGYASATLAPRWSVLRTTLWVLLVLFWAAYGVCVAYFLIVNLIADPHKLSITGKIPDTATQIEALEMRMSKSSLIALLVVAIACFAMRWLRRTDIRQLYPVRYAAFGLLFAIPLGLVLSLATPIEYVRDYGVYLKLGQSLYATGDYSDISEGNVSGGPADTLAWRPPGMALLYGLPIHFGLPMQASVWVINSLIAIILFAFVRLSTNSRKSEGPLYMVAGLGAIVCFTTVPFLLLPIAHLPAIATLALLLLLVPTDSRRLVELSWSKWLLAGLLTGASALFRANLVLQAAIFGAALLSAGKPISDRQRLIKCGSGILACALGVVIAIGPWTLRNWYVLHRFVPISTNGGMVFYSANGSTQPSEQGHYVNRLAVQLYKDVPDEVERDHEGWKRGFANISNHPMAFAESFLYRFPRLLAYPLYPINYIREQARGHSLIWIFPAFETATLFAFWYVWIRMFALRHSIRQRLFDPQQVPWPHFSLLIAVFVSLLFQNSPTFQLSFLPLILFVWFDAESVVPGADQEG